MKKEKDIPRISEAPFLFPLSQFSPDLSNFHYPDLVYCRLALAIFTLYMNKLIEHAFCCDWLRMCVSSILLSAIVCLFSLLYSILLFNYTNKIVPSFSHATQVNICFVFMRIELNYALLHGKVFVVNVLVNI